ncbi:unnamed protein product [Hermetia illucens]|uniref:Lipase domain-containing protein n=1 Tax=Hermetia illucens TaxID=343691 RepID=A0A7R8UEP9_HERIL|nr:pancreatic triacylglycerol lipase-like [Hermetia illucens]CAD7079344.1 unnamed protein product [Hermetia illucens]
MKGSLLVLVVGIACVLGYPVEDAAPEEQWELIPTADGYFRLINVKDAEFQASLEERADFDVKFFLFTKSNPSSSQQIITGDSGSLTNSYFSASRPTRIIIHGWRNDASSEVGSVVRTGYLNRGDFNVIVVDWGAGAGSLNYVTAKNNVPDAGKKVAAFINFLNAHGASSNNIYLIGHSLGAHVSGFAGKNANSKPNTIFGLDAALPLFSASDSSTRLAVGDAGYVETIHTDGGRLGFDSPIGTSSFYPAWGGVQPGCGLDVAGSCSHSRSYQYFAESLQANNQFLGQNCGDWNNLKNKVCTGGISLMGGEPSNHSIAGVFYVPVNSAYPYATGKV